MGIPCPTETTPAGAIGTLGKYELIEKLGEGYLGSVFRGIDHDLGRAVAVRVLCEGIKWDARVEERFQQQCRAIIGLQHLNIAAVFDAGRQEQSRYIAMESLGNRSLQDLIAQKSVLSVEAKLAIMIQVAEGLGFAHRNGVLHLDLTPGKIHLTADGAVKIRDFAISNVLKKYLPHPIVRWGVPIYLSPEQIQHHECDASSDIFSAGTIFYELLTFLHPFHDPNGNKTLDNILLENPIPTFERFPDLPPGIWPILKTCLARDPKDRYQSAEDLSAACRELVVSLAEDTQLMLAELYGSLTPLRKIAAQPNAPQSILRLLEEIQKLSGGGTAADYASLDRLMAVLIEHYPAIHSAGDLSGPVNTHPLSEEIRTMAPSRTPLESPERTAGKTEVPIQKQCADPEQADTPSGPVSEALAENGTAEGEAPRDLELGATPGDAPSGQEIASRILPVPQGVAAPAALNDDAALLPDMESGYPAAAIEPAQAPKSEPLSRYRKFRRPSYRTAVVLLSILVIAAAGYIVWGTEVGPIRDAWNLLLGNSPVTLKTSDPEKPVQTPAHRDATESAISEIPMQSSALPPSDAASAISGTGIPAEPDVGTNRLKERIGRVAFLIDSGRLQQAKAELDKLQQTYPAMPDVLTLRRRLQAKLAAEERGQKEEEQQIKMRRQREEDLGRQASDLFARGKYGEAAGALSVWLAEYPGNPSARELGAKIAEAQRSYSIYASAMAERRYQDALGALKNAERVNPADPNWTDLRRQAEARSAAARAVLTVHRLGGKATVLLDGRPVGKEGEVEDESLTVGNHVIAIANDAGMLASRSQEYLEGQHVVLVYDLAKLSVRPMADSDRDSLAKRRAMEEVHSFELDHPHGLLRGSCQGILSIDYYDIAYKPSSGGHGFRMPFKLFRLGRVDGRTIELFYVADGKHFQTFKVPDEIAVERFKRVWSELKNLDRQ